MATRLVDNMPAPIVIKKYIGDEGKGDVSLGYIQDIGGYGDLLDSYDTVKKQSLPR